MAFCDFSFFLSYCSTSIYLSNFIFSFSTSSFEIRNKNFFLCFPQSIDSLMLLIFLFLSSFRLTSRVLFSFYWIGVPCATIPGVTTMNSHYPHFSIIYIYFCVQYNSMSTIILSDVTAFIAALLFAVHPIHTEAVSTTTTKKKCYN